MKRSDGFLTILMLSAALTVLLASSPGAEAAGNCQSKLVGKSYDCSFIDNDFAPFTECWDFFTGGFSQYFDFDNGFDEYGCACNPVGSSFNASPSAFECSDNFRALLDKRKNKEQWQKALRSGSGINRRAIYRYLHAEIVGRAELNRDFIPDRAARAATWPTRPRLRGRRRA